MAPLRLSATSRAVLEAVERLWARHRTAPTRREVVSAAGLSSTSQAQYHLRLLARTGALERTGHKYVPPLPRCRELLAAADDRTEA